MPNEPMLGALPSGWRYTTLAEACALGGGGIQTGPFGSQLHKSDYVAEGVPSIMPTNIGDNRINTEGIARVKPADAQRLSRYLVSVGDIVYSRRGDVEKRALIREPEDGWLCGTGCLRVRLGSDGPDPQYTSYYLGHPAVRAWIVRHAHGATMPNLNTSILGALPLIVPPRTEQKRIGEMLGRLDDKIELNRRMSETLYQISQATHEAWFQAFGPGTDLPQGWRRAPLSEFFDLGIGGVWGEGSRTEKSTISAYSLRGIDCHNLAEVQLPDVPVRWISERQLKSRNVASGTILVEGSGSFCGRSLVWTESYSRLFEQPVVYSNFVKRLNPKVDSAQAIVAAFGLREAYRKGQVQAYRTGTAFPNLDVKGLLAGLEVVVPTVDVARQFVELYAPERRVLTILENETLGQLRDTLLPKLISGELRIPEAEHLVSEVA